MFKVIVAGCRSWSGMWLVLASLGPAHAQSVFVEPGQSAFMATGGALVVDGEGAVLAGLSGSFGGKYDLGLDLALGDEVVGTLGITMFADRSLNGVAGFGAGLTVGDDIGLAPFIGVTGAFFKDVARMRFAPEVHASASFLRFGRPSNAEPATLYTAGITLGTLINLSTEAGLVFVAGYEFATQVESVSNPTLEGAIFRGGVVIRSPSPGK